MEDDHRELDSQLKQARQRLAILDAERSSLLQLIATLERQSSPEYGSERSLSSSKHTPTIVRNHMPDHDKIKMFRSIFRGREDVYALRFESKRTGRNGYSPACKHEWVRGVCLKPKIRCGQCDQRDLLPITDDVIRAHLLGHGRGHNRARDFVAGIYPLLQDETCWFLAADFDKSTWQDDVCAFVESCHARDVPTGIERSRSGNGAHVWIPFDFPVPARLARRLGATLMTLTMESRPEVGLESYDRFFPNQDTMPDGQFGNLIALPFQGKAVQQGNTVFLDDNLNPYADQWAYLASLGRLSVERIQGIVDEAAMSGRVFGVRLPVVDENEDDPWTTPPSRRLKQRDMAGQLPKQLRVVLGNEIYIEKSELPPALRNRIMRIAAFLNPDFYSKQAMRKSTYDTPRIIGCAEDHTQFIGLPIGCLDDLQQLCSDLGMGLAIKDERNKGNKIDVHFLGKLRGGQELAAEQLARHPNGVLAASTAFGKTVVAIDMIAQRGVNTLVLVHRKQLMDQWIERLVTFLDIDRKSIGCIGGGKRKPTGIVDIALIQSLCRKGVVDDLVADYGHLVVDECHRIAAPSFEQVARRCRAKYIMGLSATVKRKDGHHPVIFMQCGPIRFRTDPRKDAAERAFNHRVLLRETSTRLPDDVEVPIHQVYKHLVGDECRNQQIIEDVCTSVAEGRSPLVLTERKEHIARIAQALSARIANVIIMTGGMGIKQRRAVSAQLEEIPADADRVIVATGKYIGEGFDDARLDTLFLAMPISWRGTLAQYSGRLHRDYDMKREVVIYDYADTNVPVLERMLQRRLRGYRAIGYSVDDPNEQLLPLNQ
jgi:superfamily II DNA or RNA helicase